MNQFDVQKTILAALRAHAGTTGFVTTAGSPPVIRIYDIPPTNAVFPYISFGEAVVTPNDTKTSVGTNHLVVVNTWTNSTTAGRGQVKQIQDQIHLALHNKELAVGAATARLYCESHRVMSDPDQAGVQHGVTQVRVHIP